MDKPIYEHDCEDCVFLGNYYYEKEMLDLYYCPGGDTLVARHGNYGSDYRSQLVVHAEIMLKRKDREDRRYPTVVALVLAQKANLIIPLRRGVLPQEWD